MHNFSRFSSIGAAGLFVLLTIPALQPQEITGAGLEEAGGSGPKNCDGVWQTGVCTDADPNDGLNCQRGFDQCTSGNPNTGHCNPVAGGLQCNVPACNAMNAEGCL